MARTIENEAVNGDEAYSIIELMEDLRASVWTELKQGGEIDVYRRNLQRAHIDRLAYLMTEKQTVIPGALRRFFIRSNVDASQSDIRAVVRAELTELKKQIKAAIGRTADKMSKYHLQDAVVRIDLILDPNG